MPKHNKESVDSIRYNDKELNITWPKIEGLKASKKDLIRPSFKGAKLF